MQYLTSTLIESELFGHVKGAFTGATHPKTGAFEATTNGTLFLDEIGELPLELQPKLLRVLETNTIRRVGGVKEITIDTRVVAATHRDLEQLVADGRFREDLYHRLFVLSIQIPPLRKRSDDVMMLAEHFMRTQAPIPKTYSEVARERLETYEWPGNVRELRNVVTRALMLAEGNVIEAEHLTFRRAAVPTKIQELQASARRAPDDERERILTALKAARGNRSEAARLLQMSKSTLHDKVRRLGIAKDYGRE